MFILAHLSLCWNSQLVMCPCDTWSYNSMFHSSLCYVYPCSYSYLVLYPCVKIHACSHIPVLIFILIDVSTSWCSYLFMDNHVDILTWLCVPMFIFTLDHVSMCWYSHLVIYPVFLFSLGHLFPCYIDTWSLNPVLIFSHVYVSPCWYSYLVLHLSGIFGSFDTGFLCVVLVVLELTL